MSDKINRLIQQANIDKERADRLLEEIKVMDEQIDRLTRELAEARRERDEAIARANQVGEHTAKLMTAVGGVYARAMKEKP